MIIIESSDGTTKRMIRSACAVSNWGLYTLKSEYAKVISEENSLFPIKVESKYRISYDSLPFLTTILKGI